MTNKKNQYGKIRVGHYQLECSPGNYETNIAKVLIGLKAADEQKIDIISFPESFLTGYFTNADKAKKYSWKIDGPEMQAFLERTAKFKAMFMVGFNEQRGDELFNTVIVAERGECKGCYSKAFPCYEYFSPGREFPVFEKNGIKFGVVICADGGYIEPTRILALKGARVIFAPHYNYIDAEGVINHYQKVRSDHIARAVENNIWFLRGNNINFGYDKGLEREGIGYGDSYLLDPFGEFVARSTRHTECLISADIDIDTFQKTPSGDYRNRNRKSLETLGQIALEYKQEKYIITK